MREIRLYGSVGGAAVMNGRPYLYQGKTLQLKPGMTARAG